MMISMLPEKRCIKGEKHLSAGSNSPARSPEKPVGVRYRPEGTSPNVDAKRLHPEWVTSCLSLETFLLFPSFINTEIQAVPLMFFTSTFEMLKRL